MTDGVSLLALLASGDYHEAVETAVMEVQSPDVLGACCGLLCGALRGEAAIPEEWMALLHGLSGGGALRETAEKLAGLTVDQGRRKGAMTS